MFFHIMHFEFHDNQIYLHFHNNMIRFCSFLSSNLYFPKSSNIYLIFQTTEFHPILTLERSSFIKNFSGKNTFFTTFFIQKCFQKHKKYQKCYSIKCWFLWKSATSFVFHYFFNAITFFSINCY